MDTVVTIVLLILGCRVTRRAGVSYGQADPQETSFALRVSERPREYDSHLVKLKLCVFKGQSAPRENSSTHMLKRDRHPHEVNHHLITYINNYVIVSSFSAAMNLTKFLSNLWMMFRQYIDPIATARCLVTLLISNTILGARFVHTFSKLSLALKMKSH